MNINKENINRKNQLINNARKILKEEFFGIDKVIDGVLDNVRPWFLFPETVTRPIVINLFGMTGCGKTSLVNRICELLELQKNKVYFNFGEIGEKNSYEIENSIESELGNISTPIFIYDEFQYAATKSLHTGEEKDNKTGLKPFWELLDSGKLTRKINTMAIVNTERLVRYGTELNNIAPVILEEGCWTNYDEVLSRVDSPVMRDKYLTMFRKKYVKKNEDDEPEIRANGSIYYHSDCDSVDSTYYNANFDFVLAAHDVDEIYDINKITRTVDVENCFDFIEFLKGLTFTQLLDVIADIACDGAKGYSIDYSHSLIFVLANIDEAYKISYSVNPDMSPDQFNKITDRLTIVDIKEALQSRFRNEQIARLGNIMMLYPAFSSDTFMKIIMKELRIFSELVYEKWGIQVCYDQSVIDIIYNDSVFPTHGTRPVQSSVFEIVKTKLPLIFTDIIDKNLNCSVINLKYVNDGTPKMKVDYYGDNSVVVDNFSYRGTTQIASNEFEVTLRLENNRAIDDVEKRTQVAVHESGHFVVYANVRKTIPEKLCSRSISDDSEGFMMQDITDSDKLYTLEGLKNEIMILLGGYVAEGVVFGEKNRSLGASNDLNIATKTASSIIRDYCLCGEPVVRTYLEGTTKNGEGLLVKDMSKEPEINKKIEDILNECEARVKDIFNNEYWKEMLKESAKYLSEHTSMPKDVMTEIYNKVPESYREGNPTVKFSELLNNF